MHGQPNGRRALKIAAAGGYRLLLVDPPGSCSSAKRQRYWGRLSGPLLNRIDLKVVMRRVPATILR